MKNSQQRSPEWFRERLGKVTASRVHAIFVGKNEANSYAAELVRERITGERTSSYVSNAMIWGIDTEPAARTAYQRITGSIVSDVGFVTHPELSQAGASPDGLVGNDGLIEIKCPSTNVHLHTIRHRAVPKKYYTQIQWQLACSGRVWADFVSFDPRVSHGQQLYIQRVFRDPSFIAELTKKVEHFLLCVGKMQSLQSNHSKPACANRKPEPPKPLFELNDCPLGRRSTPHRPQVKGSNFQWPQNLDTLRQSSKDKSGQTLSLSGFFIALIVFSIMFKMIAIPYKASRHNPRVKHTLQITKDFHPSSAKVWLMARPN